MWRTFFMAIAVFLIILGVKGLILHRVVLTHEHDAVAVNEYWDDPLMTAPVGSTGVNRTLDPPEWAPWSLLSAGVVVMLYAVSLKRSG